MWPFSKPEKAQLTDARVGNDLASQVADRLESGHWLGYVHRDYCGMGLCKDGTTFIYGEINDGFFFRIGELVVAPISPERLEFNSRESFVAWLQDQSDLSLSGQDLPNSWLHNNQRITVSRLLEFAANNSFKPTPLRGAA